MLDRNTVIGIAITAILFLAFIFYSSQKLKKDQAAEKQKKQSEKIASQNQVQEAQTPAKLIDSTSTSVNDTGQTATPTGAQLFKQGIAKEYSLENDVMKVTLSSKGGAITRVELKKFKTYNKKPLVLFEGKDQAFYLQFPTAQNEIIHTKDLFFTPEGSSFAIKGNDSKSFRFILAYGQGKYLEQVYTMKGNSYFIDHKIRMVNMGEIVPINVTGLNVKWNQTSRQLEKDLTSERRYSGVYYQYKKGDVEHLNLNKAEDKTLETVNWVSFKQQFFNSTLLSKDGFSGKVGTYHDAKVLDYNKQYSADLFIPVNEGNAQANYQWYFGPNDYSLLSKLNNGMAELIPLSSEFVLFKWMGFVNKWMIIPVFNLLKNITTNYGIIIFILALLVKVILTPLTYNSYKYAAVMQVLKPEMDALREKYQNDQQKLGSEQMKLYQKVGVNPLSGCFPVLLQMPILIAMYNFFPASIELRQSMFLWAEDLSTYDAIISFPPIFGGFGHISLFTVLMTLTSIFSAVMTPQMNNQDNPGMKYMPYIFPLFLFFMFNSFPAALTYYYLLFNLMSIAQQWIIKRFFIDEKKLHAELQERKKKEPKKSGWMSKLEEMQKAAEQQQAQAKKAKK